VTATCKLYCRWLHRWAQNTVWPKNDL